MAIPTRGRVPESIASPTGLSRISNAADDSAERIVLVGVRHPEDSHHLVAEAARDPLLRSAATVRVRCAR